MLFTDISSSFNTIIPQQLIKKLHLLGFSTLLCNCTMDFLMVRPQSIWVGSKTTTTIDLSTGAPQGCMPSPILLTLLTHNYTA